MRSFQQEAILKDEVLLDEIARQLTLVEPPLGPRSRRAVAPGTAVAAETAVRAALDRSPHAEAIVLRLGRPTLVVRNDTFEVPAANSWRTRLYPTKTKLEAAIRSVGRVEVAGSSAPYVGTAWMIAPNVAVTNRHVALQFGRRKGKEFVFRSNPVGQRFEPRLDFKEEHLQLGVFEAAVTKILLIAGIDDDAPDLAFLALTPPSGRQLPPPIPLFAGGPEAGQTVAVIGYPARDPRNDLDDQARLFGGIYDVKRLAPGEVMGRVDTNVFTHDATTLGGSSGSVVLDVATGAAVGLHFAGEFLDANYAVNARTLRRFLRQIEREAILLSSDTVTTLEPEARVRRSQLAGRQGYTEDFLGTDQLTVPLPKLAPALAEDAVVVDEAKPGTERFVLPYTHFSAVMHAARRFAVFTAVNIDGALARNVKRGKDVWAFDPRISEQNQVGNALYAGNDLDRGHLVRRLDPVWGDETVAVQAEKDSFFFTNSTPQHSQFNQRLWLELEDYLLGHADTLDFRACVFTGPVLGDDDKPYRGVLLPQAFWKVAVMVHAERRALTATAYLVSQADLLTNIEFVFGQFKTYQVPLAHIETLTGLRFGTLKDFDPLAGEEGVPSELFTGDDIRL